MRCDGWKRAGTSTPCVQHHAFATNPNTRIGVRPEHAELVSPRLRALWLRDDKTCHLCGRFVSLLEASADHVVPRSKGGHRTPENIRLAHRDCNVVRGDAPLSGAHPQPAQEP
jgi:5-methylcytosine-specific restriction endonuclease McrA